MDQYCELCNKVFEEKVVWAIPDYKGGFKYKSFCDDCVDNRISELSQTQFENLLKVNNEQCSNYWN